MDFSTNNVYKTKNEALSFPEVEKIIREVELGRKLEHVSNVAPMKPKGGEIFLYICKTSNDNSFLKDKYKGFHYIGNNIKPNKKQSIVKKYYRLKNAEENAKYTNFGKEVYFLSEPKEPEKPVVLIHYLGNEKLVCNKEINKPTAKVQNPTGNEKLVLNKEISKPTDKVQNPKKTLPSVVSSQDLENENLLKEKTLPRRFQNAEIFGFVEMAKTKVFGDFILHFQVCPFDAAVMGDSVAMSIASDICNIFETNIFSGETIVFKSIFVSVVKFKNMFLKNEPYLPLSFMISNENTPEVRCLFWETVQKNLTKGIKIVLNEEVVDGNEPDILKFIDEDRDLDTSLDALVVLFYSLQLNYLKVFLNQLTEEANSFKDDSEKFLKKYNDVGKRFSCTDVIEVVNDLRKPAQNMSLKTFAPTSIAELADSVIGKNLISIDAKSGVFIVRHPMI